jgi:DNA repair protein RecO (recombination protein O)
MRVEAQPGLILHARAYRETSLLLECITRDYGRVGLLARGVRRERARMPRGLIQPLQPLLLSWSGTGELPSLVAAESSAAPLKLQGDRLYSAIYVNELVLRLCARSDPHPEIFTDYVLCLQRLCDGDDEAWTLRRFERDLLVSLGYGLVLDREISTDLPIHPEEEYVYVPDEGPIRWEGQTGVLRLRGAALLALANDEIPDPRQNVELRRLMRGVIRHQLGGGSLNAWALGKVPTEV